MLPDKFTQKSKIKLFDTISLDVNDIIGKTIIDVKQIKAEFGRTNNVYMGFVCSDGSRVLIIGENSYDPKPTLEAMKESNFFNVDELVKKSENNIREEDRRVKNSRERDMEEFNKLKKRLGM